MLLFPSRSTLNTTMHHLPTRIPIRLAIIKNKPLCSYQSRLPRQYLSTTTFNSRRHYTNQPDEYELRVGYAITVLQDELPRFFDHGLQVHDIYSQHVVLSDPHYTRLSIKGRTAYLGIAEMLRWSLGCYFDKADFEIIRMRVLPDKSNHGDDITSPPLPPSLSSSSSSSSPSSLSSSSYLPIVSNHSFPLTLSAPPPKLDDTLQQYRHFATTTNSMPLINDTKYNHWSTSSITSTGLKDRPSSNIRSLEIRWQLQARPRSFNHSQNNNNQLRQVDGVFIYTFDHQGYICEHKIQRIEPTPSKTILLMHSYGGRLRAFLEALKRRSEPELRPGLGC